MSELRLEQAKQNLARVDDIFEEVTRQMGSLKRQAVKAERYAALRDEMRTRLSVVLASRMTQMDSEQESLALEIAALGTEIERDSEEVSEIEEEYSGATARGYQLEGSAREANARATQRPSNWNGRPRDRTQTTSGSRSCWQGLRRKRPSSPSHDNIFRDSPRSVNRTGAFLKPRPKKPRRFAKMLSTVSSRLATLHKQASPKPSSGKRLPAGMRADCSRRWEMRPTRSCMRKNRWPHSNKTRTGFPLRFTRPRETCSPSASSAVQASLKFESVTGQLHRLENEIAALRAETETGGKKKPRRSDWETDYVPRWQLSRDGGIRSRA